jgi:hypothetical protein
MFGSLRSKQLDRPIRCQQNESWLGSFDSSGGVGLRAVPLVVMVRQGARYMLADRTQ